MSELAKRQPSQGMEQVDTVVDCDFHLLEQQSDFISYIDEPYSNVLFDAVDDPKELGTFYPSPGLFSSFTTGKVKQERIASREKVQKIKQELGVDHVIATSSTNLYLSCIPYDDVASALASAYNAWIMDKITDPNNGIHTPIVVAPQNPQRAAEEIEKYSDEPGVVAVSLPDGGVTPPLGDSIYYPIYEAAEKAGLPMVFHSASGTSMMSFPLQFQSYNQFIANHAFSHATQKMAHLSSLLFEGVPVRFPDLEFVLQEAGIGWYPYFMRRLDHEFQAEQWQAPMLEQMPSEYLKENFYLTSQPIEGSRDPQYVSQIIRLFEGQNSLMFSSDYPHFDFDYPDELLKLVGHEFDTEEINNMYGQTAKKVFGI